MANEVGKVFVSVVPSMAGFANEVKAKLSGLDVTVGVSVGDTKKAKAQIADATKGAKATVEVDADTAPAKRTLASFLGIAAKSRAEVKIDADTRSALASVAGLASMASKVGIASIVAPAAIQSVASLSAALAPAVGILATLPAATGAGAVGVTTLKLAFSGFGDAIGDDPKKAAEAMAGMAPAARTAASAVNSLKPAWESLQLDVQGRFFDGLSSKITGLGTTYIPILRGALSGVASDLNGYVKDSFDVLDETDNINGITTALGFVRQGLSSMGGALAPFTQAFTTLFIHGAPYVAQFGAWVESGARSFSLFIGEASRAGMIEVWINDAIEVFKTLGAIVGNVGSIIFSVFSAAAGTGGNFLTILRDVTGEVAAGLRTPAGAQGLLTFFTAVHDAVQAAMPGLRAIGSALLSVIENVAPALPGVGAAFSSIAIALAPFGDMASWLVGAILPPLLGVLSALAPVLVPLAVAVGMFVGYMKLAAIVQGIWTAAVWLFNSALLANPITLIVIAIIALIGAVIWAWNNWDGFREAIIACWDGIVTAAQWAWTNVLQPIFGFIGTAVQAVGAFFVWLWQSVLVPAWNAIAAVVSWAWTNILQPIFGFIGTALLYLGVAIGTLLVAPFVIAWNIISAIAMWAWTNVLQPLWYGAIAPALSFLGSVFTWLYQNVVVPVWQGICTAIMWAWNNIIRPTWDLLMVALRFVGSVFTWLWQNVVVPVWQGICSVIMWAWNNIIRPTWDLLMAGIRVVASVFEWLYNNVIRPVWDGIGSVITFIWQNVIQPAWRAVVDGLNWLGENFRRVTDWIGDIWNRIRGYMAKPINFMIDVVWNKGIVPAWNKVANLVPGVGPIDTLPPIAEFARGGFSEDHRAQISRSGGPIRVWSEPETGGEAYIPLSKDKRSRSLGITKTVADQFGYGLVPKDRLAMYARGGIMRFADGGLWRRLAGIAQEMVPGTRMSDGYSPRPGYHGQGKAVDLVGDKPAINRALANRFANSTELIYTPGINLFRGRPHTYNAATRADHFDHVHWAMENEAMLAGAPGNYSGEGGGWFNWLADAVRSAFDSITNPAIDLLRSMVGQPPPEWQKVAPGLATRMRDTLRDFLLGKADAAGGDGPAGPGSGPVVDQVRAVANRFGWGEGPQWDALSRLIQKESSWNPTAANPNSTAYGLFQFLNGTWGTVGGKKTSNPGEQAEYGLRYVRNRYRDPIGALRFHNANNWYDAGGLASGTGLMMKQVISPERVLSPRQTMAFENLVPLLDTLNRRGSGIGSRVYDGMSGISGGPAIGAVYQQLPDGASGRHFAEELMFEFRRRDMAGVHG